jgi:hypothetical protein
LAFTLLVLNAGSLYIVHAQSFTSRQTPGVVISDAFGKPLDARGIALVDWDGYMANPAVKLLISATPTVHFPVTVELVAKEPRLYFDLPSSFGPNGPKKTVVLHDASAQVPIYLSIFPNRETYDSDYLLTVRSTEANGIVDVKNYNIHVFGQYENKSGAFKAIVDFSYDQSGLFDDPVKQSIVQQAADDWAHFIDDMQLDPVVVGSEKIWIFPTNTDFSNATLMPNQMGYTGFLLELYGVDDPQHRAGGEGSDQAFQSSHGVQLPLRRSGNVALETKGNWNTTGWLLATKDSDWWVSDNRGQHQNDLYSIAHHEMGHALGFNVNYPLEKAAKERGDFESPELLAYHGKYPKVDRLDHLAGEIDDASHRAAFGNEFNGNMPEGRWLITKLDILCLETIGYKIRRTFDLALKSDALPEGSFYTPYSTTLQAKGGLPWYEWSVESGALPDGLNLDADTGVISGQPTRTGTFSFKIRLTDSSEQKTSVVSAPLSIQIQ